MKNLQPILYIRNRSNSLYLRLIVGFLCIILLLASLTIYSFTVSKRNVKQEVVKYNTLILKNTRDNYEKHLDLIKKQMYFFYMSEEVQKLKNAPNYVNFPNIVREISTWVANPYLFIDNIVFYSKHDGYVLEKGTSTNAESMFRVFYTSEEYPLDFWNQQFSESYSMRVFPSAQISNKMFRDRPVALGEYIPIIFKNQENQDFYMVVFLDAIKMYKEFHQSLYNDLIIYDDLGQTLFKSVVQDPFLAYSDLKTYEDNEFIRNAKYHFVKQGVGTRFQYVYRVPVERIQYESRLNITLIVIMATAIVLSVVFSFLFAARINNPLKKVVESIRDMNNKVSYRTNIKEFDILSNEIRDSQAILKQVSFINHLKAIRNHGHHAMKLDFSNKPFVFVLFHLQQCPNDSSRQEDIQNWLYQLKLVIDSKLTPTLPDALTFQIERNQILSLVFTDRMQGLIELLNRMKEGFDQDREYGIMTIAVTSIYSNSDQLTVAYEEAQDRVGDRLLRDETQIIWKRSSTPITVGFSPDQDKEFAANLKEGNTLQLVALLERFFARWQSKELTAAALMRFAEYVVGKIHSVTIPSCLDPVRLESILGKSGERLQRCATVAELEQLLLDWVTKSAEAVREKKEEKHPVTAFVFDYVNEHLAEELYLDVLAEKLNLSSGYLSSYFKEKTGMNIVDYINETRITKARSLLADNRMKVHDAAKAVGYQNITSFNRMFKKYTGLTPTEFRKRND